MPTNQSGDFLLNGKPFMLARGQYKGRAWRRTGLPNAVRSAATDADAQRNALPPEISFIAVYDDTSGGFGSAYRDPANPAGIHWSENMETRFPGQLVHCQLPITPPAVGPFQATGPLPLGVNSFLDIEVPTGITGTVFMWSGFAAVMMAAPEMVVHYVPDTSASMFSRNITGSVNTQGAKIVTFGSYHYVARGALGFDRVTIDTSVEASFPYLPSDAFVIAGNRLWRSHGRAYLQSVAAGNDPTATANWSATLSIGNGHAKISDLFAQSDQVFAGLPDGLYAGDLSGTFYNVLTELAANSSGENCRDLNAHNGAVVVPYVTGLLSYYPSDFRAITRSIGPQITSNRSPVRGYIRATKAFGPWLYGGLWTGSQSYLLAGHQAGPAGDYVWSVQQRLPGRAKIGRLHVDSVVTASGGLPALPNRIWIGTDASFGADPAATSATYLFAIPRLDGNPLNSDVSFSANYIGSARVDYGRDNRGAPETLKVFSRVDINTDSSTLLSGSRYADLYYAIDGGSRVLLGRATDSPKSSLYFPSGVGSFVTGYDIELSLESFCTTPSSTPVYRSLVLHGTFLPDGPDEIQAVIRIADNLRDRKGAPMRSGSTMLRELRALGGGQPVQLIDLTGAVNWVAVQKDVKEEETYQEGIDYPELAATVKMAVLQFSTA